MGKFLSFVYTLCRASVAVKMNTIDRSESVSSMFQVEVKGQIIPIQVVRHKKAKHMRLSVRDQQRVRLTLPPRATLREARAFVERSQPWLMERLGARPEILTLTDGATIPLLGKTYTLRVIPSSTQRVQLNGDELVVMGKVEYVYALVHQFMQAQLKSFCETHSQMYARQLGVDIQSITIKNVKARWGSCSASGRLVFAWRLACVPEDIVRYVCAHEVAHLREMNHSAAFWNHVTTLYPHYAQARMWLRKHGKNVWPFQVEQV